MDSPCTHCEGQHGELGRVDTVYVGHKRHVFDRETMLKAHGLVTWRWICGCGAKGKWQDQSSNVCYHSWLNHVVNSG